MHVRSFIAYIALPLVCTVGCAPAPHESPAEFDYSRAYSLDLDAVTIPGRNHSLETRDTCAKEGLLTICARGGGEMITIVAINRGAGEVEIAWGSARYVDEHGRSHRAEPYLNYPQYQKSILRNGQSLRASVVPAEKRYYRSSRSGSGYEHVESLLPWESESITSAEAEATIEKLYRERTPVALFIPVTISQSTQTYELVFRLARPSQALPPA